MEKMPKADVQYFYISSIVTSENSSAVINIAKLGAIEIAPN